MRRRFVRPILSLTLAALVAAASDRLPAQAVDTVDSRNASTGSDSVAAAVRDYRKTGIARVVQEGSFIVFPYGRSQPTLACARLRACVVELEAGEIVLDRIIGDSERWQIAPAAAGPDGRTVLVVVKPSDCDLTTNLVLSTDRRIYDLTLDSPPCKGKSTNPQDPYARHVRFYYPDAVVQRWAASKPDSARVAPVLGVESLRFDYSVKRDKRFPWTPSQVFDDGAHVYIRIPPSAKSAELPVLFVLDEDGTKAVLNYTIANGTYVTDRLFDRAVLVSTSGGKERRLTIERTAADAMRTAR